MGLDVCLTLDADWAPPNQLEVVVELLEKFEVKATWFATDNSSVMERISANPLFEVGIHPNFYADGEFSGTQDEVLAGYMRRFPTAKVVRSHGLFSNGRLLTSFVNQGLCIDSSIFMPEHKDVQGYQLQIGKNVLTRVPFSWADDHFLTKPQCPSALEWVNQNMRQVVVMFHPVHIFLNCRNQQDYLTYRSTDRPVMHDEYGVRNMFEELLSSANCADYRVVHLSELAKKMTG
ncbi:hypothetical protein [Bowmanella denitrificans]|uniref:polysaccharide deacetylase WbmS family protein n=1 Tax=Bowmanella denitrificans TaxID=366582 RepID=UPI000C9CFAB5|nr:hypothetical protein [Bowmanella denitrificans]